MLLHPFFWPVSMKISWGRSRNFALSRDKKLHISAHGGGFKVSVKQKKFSEKNR